VIAKLSVPAITPPGGRYCDCELFLNGYRLSDSLPEPEDDLAELPPCTGAKRGSVQPCDNWERISRPR
jgi:hypothetical protein